MPSMDFNDINKVYRNSLVQKAMGIPKTPYQQNVSQPVPQGIVTTRNALGRISQIMETDPARGNQLQMDFIRLQSDPTSIYYDPYTKPTNPAISTLSNLGIDVSNINDDWYGSMNQYKGYYVTSGMNNNAKSPGKNASWEQQVGYAFSYADAAKADTDKAKQESAALQEEISFYTNWNDRNYSDKKIASMFDFNNDNNEELRKKYPTLYKMITTADAGEPMNLNEAIPMANQDWVYGQIWAARNGGGTGNKYSDMASSYLGVGNVYKEDPEKTAKLNWNDKTTYTPYSVGTTLDQEGLYFGVTRFGETEIDRLKNGLDPRTGEPLDPNDKTAMKMLDNVLSAENRTVKAEEEIGKLNDKLNKWLNGKFSEEDIVNKIDKYVLDNCPTLTSLNESLYKSQDAILGTTRELDFKYKKDDLHAYIHDECENKRNQPNAMEETADKTSGSASMVDKGRVDVANSGVSDAVTKMPSKQEQDIINAKDEEVKGAIIEVEDDLNSSESALMKNAGSVAWTALTNMWESTKAALIDTKKITQVYAARQISVANDTYKNEAFEAAQTKYDYEQAQSNYENSKKTFEQLDAKYGYLELHGKTVPETYEKDINGFPMEIHFSQNDSGYYEKTVAIPMADSGVQDYSGEYWYEQFGGREAYEKAIAEAEKEYNDYAAKVNLANMHPLTEEEQQALVNLNTAKVAMEDSQAFVLQNQDKYVEAVQIEQEAKRKLYRAYELAKEFGVETDGGIGFEEKINDALQYSKKQKIQKKSYSDTGVIDYGINGMNITNADGTKAAYTPQIVDYVDQRKAEANKDIQEKQELLDYFGDSLPANYRANIEYTIAADEWAVADYDYFMMNENEDFDEMVNAGREKDSRIMAPDSYMSESLLFWNVMTDQEKDRYHYLLGKYGDEQAREYYDHLQDDQFGCLERRETESIEYAVQEGIKESLLSAVLLNAAGIVLSPVAGIASAVGLGAKALFNQEVGDSVFSWANTFRNTVNEETTAQINEALHTPDGKDTVASVLATKAYSIFWTLANSKMNAMAFAGLGSGLGTFEEAVAAFPMASSAMFDTVSELEEQNADPWKTWLLGGITFMSEAFTEMIQLGHFSEARELGLSMTNGLMDLAKALPIMGLSEATGETASEIIQREANSMIMGEESDKAKRSWYYRTNLGMSKGEADQKASADDLYAYLETAITSFFTPFMSGSFEFAAGKTQVYKHYANTAKRYGMTMTDVKTSELIKARYAEQEANADNTNVPQLNVPKAATPTKGEIRSQESEYMTDMEILEGSKNSANVDTRTSAMESVLNLGETQENADRAKAAAAHVEDVFENGSEDIQELLEGGLVAEVNINALKVGIMYASLGGENSACYRTVTGEQYMNSSPDVKAQLLADAAAYDAQSEETQNAISESVHDNRVAEVEKQLIAEGALNGTKEASANANAAAEENQRAKHESDIRYSEMEAADKNRQAANNEAIANPSDENTKQAQQANEKFSSAVAVNQEYEQAAEKAQRKQDEAEAKLNDVKQKELTNARQEAERLVAEEDQQRKVEADKQAEVNRLAEEVRQKAFREQQVNNSISRLESDEFIRQYYPNATEDQKNTIRKTFSKARFEMGYTVEGFLNRRDFANAIKNKFGLEMSIGDTTEGGTKPRENAHIDTATGKILVDRASTLDDIFYAIMLHETTHMAEKAGKEIYNDLADAVLQTIYGEDASFEGIISAMEGGDLASTLAQDILKKKELYDSKKGGDHSYRYIAQEIVADGVGRILSGDEAALNQFVSQKPTVARRILNAIKSFLKKAAGIEGASITQAQNIATMLENALNKVAEKDNKTNSYKKPTSSAEKLQLLKDIRETNVHFDKGAFRLETIPSIYTDLFDVGDLDITISPRHSYNIMATADEAKAEGMYRKGYQDHYHGMGPEGYLEAIEALDNPEIITNGTGRDKKATPRIAIVVDTKTNGPLLAVIDFYSNQDVLDDDGRRTHALLTIYGKNGLNDYINKANDQGKVLYINKQGHFGATVQFGSDQSSPAVDQNLTQFNEYVKRWKNNRNIKYSLPSENILVEDNEGNEIAVELPGGTISIDETKFSLSSFDDDEQQKVKDALIKSGRFTAKQVEQYMADALGIASKIAEDRVRLDFDVTDDTKSMVKPNSDYGASIDASTLCAKRLVYQGTFDAIQHALPNTPLMPDDLIYLANMMREMGYETPCGICYVESRRRNLDKFADEWLQNYKGEYVPTLDEVTTSDGLEKLRKTHHQAYEDFISAMKDLNQRNPKVVQLRTEYKGEIRDMTDKAVQKAINHGGLRLQSFSDFETPHLLDMIQVVMDMSSKGLTSQAYTKVPNFAWAFGDTGIKINLSLIGKGEGVDENGNLLFDDVEGMPFEEAMKLRDRYSKNVGTILVGINDKHILAAMADPRVDYIIPFHRSGWTKNDLRLMPVIEKYTDYTLTQNERDAKTGKKMDKNLEPVGEEGYWDFSKSGKENAEAYLDLCNKNGIIPKFDQFLDKDENGKYHLKADGSTDGYWKTLIDFKMYDNDGNGSPQTAVTPNVNMAEAQRILTEYKLERQQPGANTPAVKMKDNNSLPVADEVVDRYVEEYKAKHPLDENRTKYSLPSENVLDEQIRYYLENGPQEEMQTITLQTNPADDTKQRQWGRKGAQNSDELAAAAKQYVLEHNEYYPDTNAEQIDRAIEWIRSNSSESDPTGYNTSLNKVLSKNYNYRTADGQAQMIAMMGMAIAQNDVQAQTELSSRYNSQGTSIAQALQARKLWRMMTPEGRISSLQKMLQQTQDELDAKGTKVELKFSDWIYMAAAAATEEGDMQKVQQAAAQELAAQLPANWRDRIRSIRMLSMLGNPRTHIRNIIGNALFVPVVSLKNKLGAVAELGMEQGNRTKTLAPVLNRQIREFARQDAIAMKDTLTGEAKYNEENAVQREQKAFSGLLQAVIDFNSDMLEKEDWMFLKGHYRRALGGWMQANGYTAEQLQNDQSLLEKGRAYAIEEAQKATYRDFNKLASTLNKVSREGGVAGFLVDAVLPFKKTPANILRRGIEYSPVGIMRSLTTDIYHLKQWNDAQNGKPSTIPEKALSPTQFIDRLCSGLSGSAILALGALLSSAGIVSCGLDDDEDKLEKEKGNQEYAFKFSILGHDYTFTMDWAAPMSMPFFVGAAIQEQLSQQDGFNVEELVNAFGNITEPVFNLSMLDGVNTLFKTSQYDDTNTLTQIGAKVASNYVTSYVPSLLGAIARTVDENRRKAYVESGKGTGVLGTFRYALEQTENKIPGLSQTNIPYRNVWGNPETSGLVERILENFILPGYVSEYKNDPVLNEMDRLYQITGDASMIPADPNKTVTYNKEKYVLNAEQWDTYKKERGQAAYNSLNELINTDEYKSANASVQAQMIKSVWSYADQVGKSAIIPNYDTTEINKTSVASIAKDSKITGYQDEMIKALNAGDYVAYDTMVEALHEEDVEDSAIKTKIGNTYRNQYKDAYMNGNYEKMAEIEDLLDNTGFSFDTGAWEEQVDKKRE